MLFFFKHQHLYLNVMINEIIKKANSGENLTRDDLRYILSLENEKDISILFKAAYETKVKFLKNKSYFRGLIEFSNICVKDCYYCGIRRSNREVERYMMKEEEILNGARFAYEQGYGSVVLQSGEREDGFFIDFIEKIIRKIKEISHNQLGITLSLGEQSQETYRRWFKAGAHRYLLRIESSNPELYRKLHPADHNFERRKKCLLALKRTGYQVGTGVMIGLPFQTIDDLAGDLLFFKDLDVDMIGMGPYISSKNTPLAAEIPDYEKHKEYIYLLSLKMISAARLLLRDVNIASTTALQTLKYFGREMGVLAGANILMPNITDQKYREGYQLYDNKPCLDEGADDCKDCLITRINKIGEEVGLFEWGDSQHFLNKTTE